MQYVNISSISLPLVVWVTREITLSIQVLTNQYFTLSFSCRDLRFSSYRMFISLGNFFAIFGLHYIFYEFNRILMIFSRKKLIIHK
jgi:hypothetical protein